MSIDNFNISPFITGRRTTIGGGVQNIDDTNTFNVSTVVTGLRDDVGFCIKGNVNGLDGTTDDSMRLWIDNIRTTQGFAINPTGDLLFRPLSNNIRAVGTGIGSIIMDFSKGTINNVSNIINSTGLTIGALTNFTSCPQTSILPSSLNDLVNLNYLQNNPPPSSVIFYLNNSLTPTPPISTYKLLSNLEDNSIQTSINTSISGLGTIQLIQTFANQLSNLNASSFIPAGIWDLNIFASAVLGSDITHINLYFAVFGRTVGGVETQIGSNSSLNSVDTTNIEQYKMTLALTYTDLSPFESLVIKLFGVNNRLAQTDIITYYESGATYSHLHTTFSSFTPQGILTLNNTWMGLNNWTQYITVPDIIINNNITTNIINQTSTTITLNLGNYQYKNFELTMNQNITNFIILNGVSNGEYKIYLTGGGFTFNKLIGYPNDLYGDTLMSTFSNWIIKIYCINIGTYRISVVNFT
jgi:hypothetical protein